MLAGEDGSGAYWDKRKKHMAKTDPPGLESHCLCRTPRQNSGKQTVPRKMLLSYYLSFLLQKEHALLHTALRKGKNEASSLEGSSLQHKPTFHFALQEKQGPNLPQSFLLLLKATGFVSIQVYMSMTVWTSSWNEVNCVLGSVFSGTKIQLLSARELPFTAAS